MQQILLPFIITGKDYFMKAWILVLVCVFSFLSVSFLGSQVPATPAEEPSSVELSAEQEEPAGSSASFIEPEETEMEDTIASDTEVPVEAEIEENEPEETSAPLPQILENSYFDDTVFIGDSVMGPLWYCSDNSGALGEAQFFYEVSYSAHAALDGSVYLKFRGHDMTIDNIAMNTEAKKLYIMLGANDLSLFGVDKTIENMQTIVDNVFNKCPDIKIVLMSVTPSYKNGNGKGLTNTLINKFNKALIQLAEENDLNYVDITKELKDENGDLIPEYSKDQYIHMIIDCGPIMANALKDTSNYLHYPE